MYKTSLILLFMPALIMAQIVGNGYNYVTYRPAVGLSPTFSNLNVQQTYTTPSPYLSNTPMRIGPNGIAQYAQYPNNNYNYPLYFEVRPTLQTYGTVRTPQYYGQPFWILCRQ